MKETNIGKILKLWEKYCFIFNFNHILKFKNFRVWQELKSTFVSSKIYLNERRDEGKVNLWSKYLSVVWDRLQSNIEIFGQRRPLLPGETGRTEAVKPHCQRPTRAAASCSSNLANKPPLPPFETIATNPQNIWRKLSSKRPGPANESILVAAPNRSGQLAPPALVS